MSERIRKAAKKKVVKRAIPLPREIVSEVTKAVHTVTVRSPLGIVMRVEMDTDGDIDNVSVKHAREKESAYICGSISDELGTIRLLTDEQFEDLVGIMREFRSACKQ